MVLTKIIAFLPHQKFKFLDNTERNKRRPCLVAAASIRTSAIRSMEALCLTLEDRDYFAVSVKRGEQIVGHIPRELSKRLAFVVEARVQKASDV